MNENIPSDFKKAVVFIYSENKGDPREPKGTGFWINVSLTNKRPISTYLVTARHIIEGLDNIFIRINSINGDSFFIDYNLHETDNLKPIFHHNPSIDIALLPLVPPPDSDIMIISESLFINEEFIKNDVVSEGDSIFFVGLLPQLTGKTKNTPVFRQGNIALLTDEWLEAEDGTRAPYYYVEANCYPGNSGSPVFLEMIPSRKSKAPSPANDQVRLLGVMHGYIQEARQIEGDSRKNVSLSFPENVNIALVSPAQGIRDILHVDTTMPKNPKTLKKLNKKLDLKNILIKDQTVEFRSTIVSKLKMLPIPFLPYITVSNKDSSIENVIVSEEYILLNFSSRGEEMIPFSRIKEIHEIHPFDQKNNLLFSFKGYHYPYIISMKDDRGHPSVKNNRGYLIKYGDKEINNYVTFIVYEFDKLKEILERHFKEIPRKEVDTHDPLIHEAEGKKALFYPFRTLFSGYVLLSIVYVISSLVQLYSTLIISIVIFIAGLVSLTFLVWYPVYWRFFNKIYKSRKR